MENIYKPVGTLFAASLGQLTAVMGTLWAIIALFGGTKAAAVFDRVPPLMLWAALAVCFAALHLLLKKPRPLLFLLGVCVLLSGAAALGLMFGTKFSVAAVSCYGASLLITMLFQLRWETGKFKDSTLLLQMQVLILIGICQIWLADQLEFETPWIFASFGVAACCLCGALVSKTSGLKDEKAGGKGLWGRGLLVGGTVAGCGLAVVFASAMAEPVGRTIASGYDAAEGVLSWMLNGLGKILGFLFTRNKVRLDEAAQSSSGDGATGTGQMMEGSSWDGDLFRTVFHVIILVLLAVLAVAAIRALLRFTVGASRSAVRRRDRSIEVNGTLWERFCDWIRNQKQPLRAKRILRRHPDSIAALLVYLESCCRRDTDLMRRPGETARQFLTRLAELAETSALDVSCPGPESPGKRGPVAGNPRPDSPGKRGPVVGNPRPDSPGNRGSVAGSPQTGSLETSGLPGDPGQAEASFSGAASAKSAGAARSEAASTKSAGAARSEAASAMAAEAARSEAASTMAAGAAPSGAASAMAAEAAATLRRLADAVDEACYSREGDWLALFAEGDKLRKFRFFSKKS